MASQTGWESAELPEEQSSLSDNLEDLGGYFWEFLNPQTFIRDYDPVKTVINTGKWIANKVKIVFGSAGRFLTGLFHKPTGA